MHAGALLAGRYRVVRQLGSGGMADVFLAEDERLGRRVAVKVLPPHLRDDPAAAKRILREAQAVAALNHPNIVSVHDVVEESDVAGIVMEEVTGPSLKELLDGAGLDLPSVTRIMEQVCAGLSAAHERGLVHRDIKPSNVLLTDRGDAKLVDFGVAAILDETAATSTLRGSVPYVAPEQAQGLPPDTRGDIYGLGCLLHELLTGAPPFTGTTMEVLGQHLEAPPPRPSDRRPDVPPALDDIVIRALAKEPEDRFEDAAEMAAAITALDLSRAPSPAHDRTMALPAETTVIAPVGARRTGLPVATGALAGHPAEPRFSRRQVRQVGVVAGIALMAIALVALASPADTQRAFSKAAPPSPSATPSPTPSPSPTVASATSLDEAVELMAAAVADARTSGDLTDEGHEKLEERIRELRAKTQQGPPWERSKAAREQLDKFEEELTKLADEGHVSASLERTLQELVVEARALVPDPPPEEDD